jgi:xylitol oxidase
MNLITGSGDRLRIDHTSPGFAAAVVHLGALGVVTELTLAIEPSAAASGSISPGSPMLQQ